MIHKVLQAFSLVLRFCIKTNIGHVENDFTGVSCALEGNILSNGKVAFHIDVARSFNAKVSAGPHKALALDTVPQGHGTVMFLITFGCDGHISSSFRGDRLAVADTRFGDSLVLITDATIRSIIISFFCNARYRRFAAFLDAFNPAIALYIACGDVNITGTIFFFSRRYDVAVKGENAVCRNRDGRAVKVCTGAKEHVRTLFAAKHQITGAVDVAIKECCLGHSIHIGQRKAAAIDSDSAVSAKIKRIPIEGEVIFCFNNGQIGVIFRTVLDG